MFRIDYEKRQFDNLNPWGIGNGSSSLHFSRHDLAHAAISVGSPNLRRSLNAGNSFALAEALWKLGSIALALEAYGNPCYLYASPRFEGLDPSEKQGITYHLGMTITQLFSTQLLGVPFLRHIDLYRDQLAIQTDPSSKSRPDLVGRSFLHGWVIFEAKGRTTPPGPAAVERAKQQAQRVETISGIAPTLSLGCLAHFERSSALYARSLQAVLVDPVVAHQGDSFSFDLDEETLLKDYYAEFQALFEALPDFRSDESQELLIFDLKNEDLQFVVAKDLFRLIQAEEFTQVPLWLKDNAENIARWHDQFSIQADGLGIRLGSSWEGRLVSTEEG